MYAFIGEDLNTVMGIFDYNIKSPQWLDLVSVFYQRDAADAIACILIRYSGLVALCCVTHKETSCNRSG
jgi:hypothetical protein